MVSLRNSNAYANDSIMLFSIQMQMSMHKAIVTAIVIMTDYDKICHDNDCGDDNLMHAHFHLNNKISHRVVALTYVFLKLTIMSNS